MKKLFKVRRGIVDICVVAVAKYYIHDKDYQIAKQFVKKIENGKFKMFTPFPLIETVMKWKDKALKKEVVEFYSLHSSKILSLEEIRKKFEELKMERKKLIPMFEKNGIKEEDATLVIICSAFQLPLITLNRKHLYNKKNEINKILKEVGLNEVEILLPNEI